MAHDLKLTKIPAFGFENENWGAFAVHSKIASSLKGNKEKTAKVSVIAQRHRQFQNIRKILEMVPLLGMFIGLVSFIDFCTKKGRGYYSVHFVERHLIAVTGFGFVLPIADIIATVVRNKQAKKLATTET